MKLTIKQLRTLIREALEEEADVPGRYRGDGGYSEDPLAGDLARLGHHGHPSYFSGEELDEEDDPSENTNQ